MPVTSKGLHRKLELEGITRGPGNSKRASAGLCYTAVQYQRRELDQSTLARGL